MKHDLRWRIAALREELVEARRLAEHTAPEHAAFLRHLADEAEQVARYIEQAYQRPPVTPRTRRRKPDP